MRRMLIFYIHWIEVVLLADTEELLHTCIPFIHFIYTYLCFCRFRCSILHLYFFFRRIRVMRVSCFVYFNTTGGKNLSFDWLFSMLGFLFLLFFIAVFRLIKYAFTDDISFHLAMECCSEFAEDRCPFIALPVLKAILSWEWSRGSAMMQLLVTWDENH